MSDLEPKSYEFDFSTCKCNSLFEYSKTLSQDSLEGPLLEYQTLEREYLLCPARAIYLRLGVDFTFASGALLQRGLQT